MADSPDALLSSLLSDPEVSRRLSSVLSGMLSSSAGGDMPPPDKEAETASAAAPQQSSPPPSDIMAKLPSIMSALRTALPTDTQKGSAPRREEDKRIALLSALRPYLSPARREAVDYIIKLSRVGDILSNLG